MAHNYVLERFTKEVESRGLKIGSKAYRKARSEFFADEVDDIKDKLEMLASDRVDHLRFFAEVIEEKGSQDDKTRFGKRVGIYQGLPKLEQAKVKNVKKDKAKEAMVAFVAYMGNETRLDNWQRLCRDLRMVDIPTSITQCKKVRAAVQCCGSFAN